MSCSFDITKDILQFYNKPYDERELEENEIMKDVNNVEGIDEVKLNDLYKKLILITESNKKHDSDENDDEDDDDDPVTNILKNLVNEMKNKQTDNELTGTDDSIQSISNINFIEDEDFVKKILLYRFLEIQKKILYVENDIVFYNYIIACILNNENKIKLNAGIDIGTDAGTDNNTVKQLKKNKIKLNQIKLDIFNKLDYLNTEDRIEQIFIDNICTYDFLNKQYSQRIWKDM